MKNLNLKKNIPIKVQNFQAQDLEKFFYSVFVCTEKLISVKRFNRIRKEFLLLSIKCFQCDTIREKLSIAKKAVDLIFSCNI